MPLTSVRTLFFLASASPDWVTCCVSDPPSFLWTIWELTRAFASAFLLCELPVFIRQWACMFWRLEVMPPLRLSINEGHAFAAEGSSTSILNFTVYLSFALYNSILRLSTEFMSSLMYWRSVCIYKTSRRQLISVLLSFVIRKDTFIFVKHKAKPICGHLTAKQHNLKFPEH